ncbi:hypothetical protein L208DRAFT_676915 [Tricholoma matsutake]|nr:hypothetical protein L208DRAFT_676915 [Tricholoma matsutake 945]
MDHQVWQQDQISRVFYIHRYITIILCAFTNVLNKSVDTEVPSFERGGKAFIDQYKIHILHKLYLNVRRK